MKHTLIIAMLLLTSLSFSQPGLAAFHGTSKQTVLALNENGNFYSLTTIGWLNTENPCPGDGPFQLEIVEHPTYPESLLIISFNSQGSIFSFSDSTWSEALDTQDSSQSEYCFDIFNVNESGLSIMIIDNQGNIRLSSGADWDSSFPDFTLAKTHTLVALYDTTTATLAPFILGEDGQIYIFMENEWQALVDLEAIHIVSFDCFMHPTTGEIFLIAIDNDGFIYDNFSGDFALSNLNECPGIEPFNLKLIFSKEGIFDVLCLDSIGNLFIANTDNTWNQVASDFSE